MYVGIISYILVFRKRKPNISFDKNFVIYFFEGNYIAKHLENVSNVDKPNPYLRWTDRWEPLPENYIPNYDYHGQNRSVPQNLLVYNKVPRVCIL